MDYYEKLNTPKIYLYGMTVLSTIHKLAGPYPEADTYQEILETYVLPGGETGNSAIILANFGCRVKIAGPMLGMKSRDSILEYGKKLNIDCSELVFDPEFEGIQDLVLVDGNTRTVFGKFGGYFSGPKRWSKPDAASVRETDIVAIDPFFGEESELTVRYAVSSGKPYVTIDCTPDCLLFQYAAATVISNEFIQNNFPGVSIDDLFLRYTDAGKGLVIFTFGSREIVFGRQGGIMNKITPYQVAVKSTLGAGDTFRGGVVYGLLNGWDDEKTVRFAAATAASVCTRFPMALDPPGLAEITALMNGEKA